MLSSVGLWLNASKSESMLESDETRPLELETCTHRPLVVQDRMTEMLVWAEVSASVLLIAISIV